jgi:hypothetical protein
MSLPQNITDDLALLDSDAATTATAVTADAASDDAVTAAAKNKTVTAAALTAAQSAQAQQVAKTLADITAAYGQPAPTPTP